MLAVYDMNQKLSLFYPNVYKWFGLWQWIVAVACVVVQDSCKVNTTVAALIFSRLYVVRSRLCDRKRLSLSVGMYCG